MGDQATILVVDDSPDNVTILRTLLEARGYRVVSAPDGRSALARVREDHPDLVLLDVMMPGMDGWQVCRAIKGHADFASIRVVMVTARSEFEDRMEGMRSGADDYVAKPLNLAELELKVRRNLAAMERRS